ncbi:hypothetical protein MHI57_24425 [Cytobacillus sp. FSL K6-0129]|uniref:hypothetical protein n=1 Tax=unclassified Cytobacillus TaxID=2675268 RepID=UPI0030F91BA8
MKKLLSLGLSTVMVLSLAIPANASENVVSNDQPIEVDTQEKTVVIDDNSVFLEIDGVEVEFVGGAEQYNADPGYLEEAVKQADSLVESSKNENVFTPFVIPDQGSGGRWGGTYNNYFAHNVYNSVKYSIAAAVGSLVALGGLVLSQDTTTAAITGAFSGVVAAAVVDTAGPDYTSTYYLASYSAYYKRTIYKQVTNIYRNAGRTDLRSIKVSQPLDKVNNSFFRAAR